MVAALIAIAERLPRDILAYASIVGAFVWGILWASHKATIWPLIICVVLAIVFRLIVLVISMSTKEAQ